MARTLIQAPAVAKRGEIIELRVLIQHPMETGFRPGAEGKILARDIVQVFTCRYDKEVIFRAELYPAIAANPYLGFTTVATVSGTLHFHWQGDHGFNQTETHVITVSD